MRADRLVAILLLLDGRRSDRLDSASGPRVELRGHSLESLARTGAELAGVYRSSNHIRSPRPITPA